MAAVPSRFRELFLLDPDVVFLNHGSFGACPRAVLEEQDRLRALLEREPVRFFVERYPLLLDEALAALGLFLDADPEGLAFLTNATTGVNTALAALDLGPGDELVVTDHAYGACRNALERAAERAGARVNVVPLPFPLRGPDEIVERIAGALGPRARLLLVDHVTSPTALVMPLEEIVGEARRRSVPVLVDGAHAPGQVELSVRRLAPDFYAGNLHKWVCAPKGAAFLWVSPEWRERVRPLVVSHGAAVREEGRTRFRSEFDWQGTHDPTPYLCAPKAIAFLGGLFPGGWEELRARNRSLCLRARALLLDALGIDAPAPEEMVAQMATVPLPDGPAGPAAVLYHDPLQDDLFARERIETWIAPWPQPPRRVLRISAQVYNEEEDYERLAEALKRRLGATS